MSEKVEQVARAIDPGAFDKLARFQLSAYENRVANARKKARAAIEAMREPTAAMLAHGTLFEWQAMIDEALR